MPSSSDSTMSLGCSARNQVPSAMDIELCDAGITTWSKGTSHRASKPLHAVVFTAEAVWMLSSWGRLPGMISAARTSSPTPAAATGISQRTRRAALLLDVTRGCQRGRLLRLRPGPASAPR